MWSLVLLAACSTSTPPEGAPADALAPPADALTTPPDDLPESARTETWRAMAEDDATPRHPSDGGGSVRLVETDGLMVAGASATFRLELTVGPEGIAAGGAVVFQAPPFWGWSPPQHEQPAAPGYTTFSVRGGPDALTVDGEGTGMLRATTAEPLPPGAVVSITYGAGEAGARVDRFREAAQELWVAVDGDGDGVRALVDGPPTVAVAAGPPVTLHVTGPSTARPGDVVRLTVAALDARANRTDASGAVTLEGASSLGLSGGRLEDGVLVLEGRATEAGLLRVTARGPGSLSGTSNPLVVHPDAQRVLWADLQVHTGMSDGTGALDDVYAYARDVANLDGLALTDHDHWGMRFLDRTPELWEAQQAAAERWHAPGAFVTFPAYEWTNWLYGHRHVLYVGTPGPVYGSLYPATRTPEGLWEALAGHDALTIAHHTAGGPVAVDWRHAPPPEVEPNVEIVSVHGSSESADTPRRIYGFEPGHAVRDALARGYRLGFLGSTDGHDGHPGLAHLAGPNGGVAAVLTDDRSRGGIAAALRARRVYATSGPRIVLRVAADGVEMGGVAPAGRATPLGVRVFGTAPVERLELVRDGAVVDQVEPRALAVSHTFDLEPAEPGSWVYVRAVQVDQHAAWSSPIWFE